MIPLALLVAFIGLSRDRAAGEPDLDGRDRLRHPRRRRRRAGRERHPRDRARAAGRRGAALLRLVVALRGRRRPADVLRDGDHHRGADAGVHAAVASRAASSGRSRSPTPSRCVGALVFSLTLVPALCAVLFRPRDARAMTSRAGSRRCAQRYRDVARPRARATRRVAAARASRSSLRAGSLRRALGTEFLPELDEGDFECFVEMPPSIALDKGQDLLVDVRQRILDVSRGDSDAVASTAARRTAPTTKAST